MFINWRRIVGLDKEPQVVTATGLGPDYPDVPGDRERGRFRLSQYPRLTLVGVSNDDGTDVGVSGDLLLEQLVLETAAIRMGIELLVGQIYGGEFNLREAVARQK